MQQIITAKLKLTTTPEQHDLLRQTQLAYRDALNYVSQWAFEHNKTSNANKMHKGTYRDVRMQFKLLSQMSCSVMRQVAATYKTLWTKSKKNAEHRKAGYTKKRFKGLDNPPRYVSPTVTYVYGHDYTFKSEQQVRMSTLQGCIVVSYQGYNSHITLIQHGASIGGAKLCYDKPHKQFYLLVSLELEIAEPTPEVQQTVVGVDVGQRYLAATATITEESQFFSGKAVRAKADHYARLHKRLQRKGTRSAKRRMIAISGRERRLKLNTNHVIAKTIVEAHPHTLIGLEDLTGIRERTKRRKHRRKGKRLLPLTPKQRRVNRHASKWAFAELHNFIAYKAALTGSMAIKVDANYTSKACPMCGYIDKKNRPQNGLAFICQSQDCHYRIRTGRPYTLHADLIGARNIAMRTLLIRQDWVRTGQLSVAPGSLDGPDVSDNEAKAARLARYAELRWSPDANF
jgi:IS605 OrfB family transposase